MKNETALGLLMLVVLFSLPPHAPLLSPVWLVLAVVLAVVLGVPWLIVASIREKIERNRELCAALKREEEEAERKRWDDAETRKYVLNRYGAWYWEYSKYWPVENDMASLEEAKNANYDAKNARLTALQHRLQEIVKDAED